MMVTTQAGSTHGTRVTPETLSVLEDEGVVVLREWLEQDAPAAAEAVVGALGVEGALDREARFVHGAPPAPADVLYRHPDLVALAQGWLGTVDVAVYMNRLLVKDAAWSGAVALHQDMPYFHGGTRKLSVFVPLTATQAVGGNGGLQFWAGSHKYGLAARGTLDASAFAPMRVVAPTLAVGDAVAMDFMTWHASEAAEVPGPRPLVQIVYQPASDGSYGGPTLGVASPMLASGAWQTDRFWAFNTGVVRDAA